MPDTALNAYSPLTNKESAIIITKSSRIIRSKRDGIYYWQNRSSLVFAFKLSQV